MPQELSLSELKHVMPGFHRLFPDSPDYLMALAQMLLVKGLEAKARECLDEACRAGAADAAVALLLARHELDKFRYAAALELICPFANDQTRDASIFEVVANCHFNLNQFELAATAYAAMLRLNPTSAYGLASYAGTLSKLYRYQEGEQAASQALRYDPRHAVALHNLEHVLVQQGKFDQAEEVVLRGLRLHPDDPTLTTDLAFFHLHRGNFRKGWRLWEARFASEPGRFCRHSMFRYPRWNGESFAGKTLLIYGEQGIGDNIMAARLLYEVKRRGGRLVMEVQPALTGLLGRHPAVDAVYELNPARDLDQPFDLWIPSMSLMRIFEVSPQNAYSSARYLWADDSSVEYWRSRIGSGHTMRVGIAWSGNPVFRNDNERSVPYRDLCSLLELSEVSFFSLQLAPGWDALHPKPPELTDFSDELLSMSDTAALTEAMDLVISVDTSVLHLAGALGKPAWQLSAFQSEWRWGAGETTYWYPSVSIFRQARAGDWASLIEPIKRRLREVAKTDRTSS